MVSIVKKLVAVRDKIPGFIKAAIDVIPLIGAANFELNMWPEIISNWKLMRNIL